LNVCIQTKTPATLAVSLILTCLAINACAGDIPTGDYSSQNMTLRLEKDGVYHVLQDGKPAVDGTYSAKNDVVTFGMEKDPMACYASKGKGSYRWTYAEKKLPFSKVDGACDDRNEGLTAGPWVRKE
jgi:hypothetical protein